MTDGEFGEVPDWYALLRAAKYLGVSPWDLLEQPAVWLDFALNAEYAEHAAVEQLRRRKQ